VQGEAYFDVERQEAPFIVRSGNTTVRVLGTVFGVRHYATDTTVRVSVLRGKVTAHGPRSAITLTPRMVAQVGDSTITTAMASDTALMSGWANGHLVFRDAPTPDVLAELTRWYGYQFRLGDPALAATRLTVRFRTGSGSRSEALAKLKPLLNVELTFNGDVITLHSRRRATNLPRPHRDSLVSHPAEVGR
jgi:transmembrane sensor